MAMFKEKVAHKPKWLKVGVKVNVVGEGGDIFKVVQIDMDGKRLVDVHLDCGWREPLCKIYNLNGKGIKVSIGECDGCGKSFPDSCIYHDHEGKVLCQECFDKLGIKPKGKLIFRA